MGTWGLTGDPHVMDRVRTFPYNRPSYVDGDFGAPMLLLVSVAAAAVSVAAIVLVGLTGTGWAVAVALIAALAATSAVIGYIAKMLAEGTRPGG
jgi:hypothetical protein